MLYLRHWTKRRISTWFRVQIIKMIFRLANLIIFETFNNLCSMFKYAYNKMLCLKTKDFVVHETKGRLIRFNVKTQAILNSVE